MDPDLLTQLVRAGNDGVIPAPLAGEDMRAYKFRAACAGAVVAAQWMEKTMAEKAQAAKRADDPETSGAGMGGGRPDDVTGTSPGKTAEEIDEILRRPHLNGAGTRGDRYYVPIEEIGVD